jgi:DNA-binding transcriptional ArsR family regulator
MDETTAVRSLGALAQPARLRVFRALVVAGQGGLTPGALSASLGVPPNTLSFHLKELTATGLVTQERVGRHIVYRAAYARMTALMAYLTEHCCQGACAPEAASASACG